MFVLYVQRGLSDEKGRSNCIEELFCEGSYLLHFLSINLCCLVLHCTEPGVPVCCSGVWRHDRPFFLAACLSWSRDIFCCVIQHRRTSGWNSAWSCSVEQKVCGRHYQWDSLCVPCIWCEVSWGTSQNCFERLLHTSTSLLMLYSWRHLTTATDTVERLHCSRKTVSAR